MSAVTRGLIRRLLIIMRMIVIIIIARTIRQETVMICIKLLPKSGHLLFLLRYSRNLACLYHLLADKTRQSAGQEAGR